MRQITIKNSPDRAMTLTLTSDDLKSHSYRRECLIDL